MPLLKGEAFMKYRRLSFPPPFYVAGLGYTSLP